MERLCVCVCSVFQCPTFCDLMVCRPPGSSVHGIFQERILERVAISSCRGSSWSRHQTQISCINQQITYHWATWEAQWKDYYVWNTIGLVAFIYSLRIYWTPYLAHPWWLRASACNAGDLCSTSGLGRSPGEENSNPLQYSCLENPMDGEAWWATVHGVAKSRTRLSDFTSFYLTHLVDRPQLPAFPSMRHLDCPWRLKWPWLITPSKLLYFTYNRSIQSPIKNHLTTKFGSLVLFL